MKPFNTGLLNLNCAPVVNERSVQYCMEKFSMGTMLYKLESLHTHVHPMNDTNIFVTVFLKVTMVINTTAGYRHQSVAHSA